MSHYLKDGVTPDRIAANCNLTSGEKLEALRDMEYELMRYATKSEVSIEDVENRVAALNREIARVKSLAA